MIALTRLRFALAVLAIVGMGGCSLVVDFDRSLLLDAGVDAAADTELVPALDASADAAVDPPLDAGDDAEVPSDAPADAG